MLRGKYIGSQIVFGTTVLLFVALFVFHPTIDSGSFSIGKSEDWTNFNGDLGFSVTKRNDVHVSGTMQLAWWQPKSFAVRYNGCVKKIFINNERIPLPKQYKCAYPQEIVVHAEKVMRSGINTIEFFVKAPKGQRLLSLRMTNWQLLRLFAVYIASGMTLMLYARNGISRVQKVVLSIFLLGVALRIFYMHQTPINYRGHDYYSHLEYIVHIFENWSVPKRYEGWVFYHPPLYYFFSALVLQLDFLLSGGKQTFYSLQMFSAFCSTCTLFLGKKIFDEVFTDHRKKVFAFLLFAFFPVLILFASRINNDALAQVLLYAGLYALLLWWKNPDWKHACVVGVVLSLGVLTKTNALILVPAFFVCLLYKFGVKHPQLWKQFLLTVALLSTLTGWFVYQRVAQEGQTYIVANAKGNNNQLRVQNSVSHMTTFSPIRLIQQPFNNPWLNDETKSNFLEYFYRSAFFGEFNFKRQSSLPIIVHIVSMLIMSISLFILSYVVYGLVEYVHLSKSSIFVPLFYTAVFAFVCHIALRITPPTSAPGQDFRHSVILLAPIISFVVLGVEKNTTLPKHVGWLLITLLSILHIVLIISISL